MRFALATVIAPLVLASAGCLDFDQFGAGAGDGPGSDGDTPADAARTGDFAATVDARMHDLRLSDRDGDVATVDGSERMPDLATGDLQCAPNTFVGCMGSELNLCSSQGMVITLPCGGQCMGPDNCGLCTPSHPFCDQKNNAFGTCTSQAGFGTETPCAPPVGGQAGECANEVACKTCESGMNGFLCGDTNAGSSVGTQYSCVNNQLANPVVCAFGCDAKTGRCRDLVPANSATANQAAKDSFTCTGTPALATSPIAPLNADVVKIDTGVPSVTLNNVAQMNFATVWGAPYVPAGGSTKVRVLHVKSINAAPGSTISVTGPYALILLVDGDAQFLGNTLIDVAADHSQANGAGGDAPVGSAMGGAGGPGQPGPTGGGGAGHGTSGGKGGGFTGNTQSAPGAAFGVPVLLEGGTIGGAGAGNSNPGGAGGGALQITACGTILVAAGVIVNASGGGGSGGVKGGDSVAGTGGGGGGSGGTILLEAGTVNIAGELVANGGGGGSGGTGGNAPLLGLPGANWDSKGPIGTAAPGGVVGGGNGGALATAPGDGTIGALLVGGGGGGGAVGRIFLNTTPTLPKLGLIGTASPSTVNSFVCVTDNNMAPNPCVYP